MRYIEHLDITVADDAPGEALTAEDAAAALGCSVETVEAIRRGHFCEGLHAVLGSSDGDFDIRVSVTPSSHDAPARALGRVAGFLDERLDDVRAYLSRLADPVARSRG